MLHLLKTQDRLSGSFYFTQFEGDVEKLPVDPHKKFQSKDLEDGTKSVVTEIHKSFGTQKSFNYFVSDLPNYEEPTLKKAFIKEPYVNPIAKVVNEVTPPVDEIIEEPVTEIIEAIVEEPVIEETKPAKGNKKSSK